MKRKIMIIDNHALIRTIVTTFLQETEDLLMVCQAKNGDEGIKYLKNNKVDVVLLDIVMPNKHGIEVLREIMDLPHPPKVIMLTGVKDKGIILKAINMGASGYVSKEAPASKCIEAIREVCQGETCLIPPISSLLNEEMDELRDWIMEADRIHNLTKREKQVMQLISQGMSNQKISEALQISDKTVKNHVSNLLRKMQLKDRTQIAIFALQNTHD